VLNEETKLSSVMFENPARFSSLSVHCEHFGNWKRMCKIKGKVYPGDIIRRDLSCTL